MAETSKPAWVTRLESHFGASLPKVLVARYQAGDGEIPDAHPFRLLSADEVIDVERSFSADRNLLGGVPMFEDDNGNFALVYLKGALEGRVAFLEDGAIGQVAFRSVDNFLAALAQLSEDDSWREMTVDYFDLVLPFDRNRRPSPEEREADLAAAAKLREVWSQARQADDYDAGEDEQFYKRNLIALTPPDRYEDLREFWSGRFADPFAVAWLSCTGDDTAIGPIEEVIREGNQPIAYMTLTWLGTERAREVLFAAASRCPSGHAWHAAVSLIDFGVPVRHEITAQGEHRFLFQIEPNGPWRIVGSTIEVHRENKTAIACGTKRNRQGVNITVAFTPAALDEIRRRFEASKYPDQAWARLAYVDSLGQRYGRKLAIRATHLLPPTCVKLETPQLRLALDRETWEEFDSPRSLPAPGFREFTYTFDYVTSAEGTEEFVRWRV